MATWPPQPLLYEINTWVWLGELVQRYGRPLTLAEVPDEEWDAIAGWGFDAVWLMGVWERSPLGRDIAMSDAALVASFRNALPDYRPDDNAGSPYCVHRYVVDPHLGGPAGLTGARAALAARGVRLVLDFVPNHVAPDHPWVYDHPEYFIHGTEADLAGAPLEYLRAGESIIARGRDPFFPPWQDVLQLNVFDPGMRIVVVDTLCEVAAQCDGLRCDMAMLVTNRIFARTWGERAGQAPPTEYWTEVIDAVTAMYPGTLFLAEAYWDLEWELQRLGFDYCYDKRLCDRLASDGAPSVLAHLHAPIEYQSRLVRFIENHDERRAASAFAPAQARAAAVVFATLPGAKLFHEGQLEGRRARLPVFLARRVPESPDSELRDFYHQLLASVTGGASRAGTWQLIEPEGWPDNGSFENLVAWCWAGDAQREIVVVNLSNESAEGRVRLPWHDLAGAKWTLTDRIDGSVYPRDGIELLAPGLYVKLPPWGYHFLAF